MTTGKDIIHEATIAAIAADADLLQQLLEFEAAIAATRRIVLVRAVNAEHHALRVLYKAIQAHSYAVLECDSLGYQIHAYTAHAEHDNTLIAAACRVFPTAQVSVIDPRD